MDEYTPKHYDLAQLKFICKDLYTQGLSMLANSENGSINDQTTQESLHLIELIEHIFSFNTLFLLKYPEDSELTENIEFFLDDTENLFASYTIEKDALKKWHKDSAELLSCLNGEGTCARMGY